MRAIIFLCFLLFQLHSKERIIAMSPAISEILFGLGLGDQVVGVSDYATFPKEVQNLPKIGGYFHPSLEKIIALKPTLVVTNQHESKIAKQLEDFGLQTLQLELSTLDNIKASIEKLALHTKVSSKPLITSIDKALKKAQSKKPSKTPRVLVIYGLSHDLSGGIYIAGHKIFFEDIITACGGSNAFEKNFIGQPVLNYESLIVTNPDIVILLHNKLTDKEDRKSIESLWSKVPVKASLDKQIHILDAEYISLPSHRVASTINDICKVIHAY
ncbi:MAG: helical backbone metal receptor [Thiovulaceae bacterium]|nr:helical backbone metal receptor [Sulfurimonadaceae bacterium]